MYRRICRALLTQPHVHYVNAAYWVARAPSNAVCVCVWNRTIGKWPLNWNFVPDINIHQTNWFYELIKQGRMEMRMAGDIYHQIRTIEAINPILLLYNKSIVCSYVESVRNDVIHWTVTSASHTREKIWCKHAVKWTASTSVFAFSVFHLEEFFFVFLSSELI